MINTKDKDILNIYTILGNKKIMGQGQGKNNNKRINVDNKIKSKIINQE